MSDAAGPPWLIVAAGSLAVPRRARAQPAAPLRVGVLTDLSGQYRDNSGPTGVLAARQAVEDFRPERHGLAVEIIAADHQQKPDVASADLTGKYCSPNMVHWAPDTWGDAHSTGEALLRAGRSSWSSPTTSSARPWSARSRPWCRPAAARCRARSATRSPARPTFPPSWCMRNRAAMAWEAAPLDDPARLAMAGMVLRHRVLPRDPLAADE